MDRKYQTSGVSDIENGQAIFHDANVSLQDLAFRVPLTNFDCGLLSLKSFRQDTVRVSVFARQLADIGVVQRFQAPAVHDHCAIGSNGSLENDGIDVDALFLVSSAKAPVD